MGRLHGAIEDTFVFMDNMGAANSVSKSHMYASHGDLRRTLRTAQWGTLLAEERGGKLEYTFPARISSAAEFVKRASETMGQHIQYSSLKPDGNTICVDSAHEHGLEDYPVSEWSQPTVCREWLPSA